MNRHEIEAELYKKYKTPADFLKFTPAELEAELRSINFYRNKTKSVLACCKSLVDDHGGEVPKTMEELVKLASNDALQKIDVMRKQRLANVAGGMPLPGLV